MQKNSDYKFIDSKANGNFREFKVIRMANETDNNVLKCNFQCILKILFSLKFIKGKDFLVDKNNNYTKLIANLNNKRLITVLTKIQYNLRQYYFLDEDEYFKNYHDDPDIL